MLTEHQISQIEVDGFVTVDTPFTDAEVCDAAAAADAVFGDRSGGFVSADFDVPELLRLMLHPFVETAARQMLRAEAVALRAAALRKTPPKIGAAAALEGEHADIRYSAADLDASPRAILCTVLIWLTDVTPARAPLMYRAGSHRQLAQLHHGPPEVNAHGLDKLPRITYAQPTPLLARSGQISVGTTGVVHSGSINTDTFDRKVIFTQFQALGVSPVLFEPHQNAEIERCLAQFRAACDPDRRHLIWR